MSNQGQRRADKNRRRKLRKTTIVTNGRRVPGLPFQGETMTCVMCGKVQQSDPKVESNWRIVEPDGVRYYVCPDHFPPDTGTTEQFKQAYMAVLLKIMSKQET